MQRRYVTIDVFTDHAFGGNPLGVVLDATGLSPAQMQTVAREFNYSETTFVLPPADPAHTAQVRIFTPVHELPFAGHPNVGTALVLAARAEPPPVRLVFEEAAGLVPLQVTFTAGRPVAAELTAPRPFSRGANADPAKVAAAVGLAAPDVLVGAHRPTMGTMGAAFLFAELAGRDALRAARPHAARLLPLLEAAASGGLFLYTRDGADVAHDLHARMFFPLAGIVEDPATGSAAVALAALLATLTPQEDLDQALRIGQGEDMGRPSLLCTRTVKRGGKLVTAHVGGGGVEIMQGTFFSPVPPEADGSAAARDAMPRRPAAQGRPPGDGMKKVGTLGSCLSGLTAALMAGDYRWKRLNNTTVDRSDVFLKYFIRQERFPPRAVVERLFALRPEQAAQSQESFDRMFRNSTGGTELPPETVPLIENLERERFDLLLLDNLLDTQNIKGRYAAPEEGLDFEFNFPIHWCARAEELAGSLTYFPCLDPAESARCWAEIARYLHAVQPAAHIMFLCASSSTFGDDGERRARAQAFVPALRRELAGSPVEIVPPLHLPAS